jgi:cytochrome c biogenesis protein CcdA
MTSVSFAFALGAGVLAAFNPCAFAMLPSFLAYFLGVEDESFVASSWPQRLWLGAWTGLLVASGFVLMFLLAGVFFASIGSQLVAITPWFAVLVGGLLIGFGVLVLIDRAPHLAFANPVGVQRRDRSLGSIFLYGIGYGIASLSCTLPIFLMVIGGALSAGTLLAGLLPFVGYSGGMALVVVGSTLATALLKGALVKRLRRVLPYVNRASGVLLVAAGAYIVYFQLNFSIFLRQ